MGGEGGAQGRVQASAMSDRISIKEDTGLGYRDPGSFVVSMMLHRL